MRVQAAVELVCRSKDVKCGLGIVSVAWSVASCLEAFEGGNDIPFLVRLPDAQ